MSDTRKNAYVAGTLNFFLPGLGYLYVGSKRSTFAVLMSVSTFSRLHEPNRASA